MSEAARKLQPQPASDRPRGRGKQSSLSPAEKLARLRDMKFQHVESSLPNFESWADCFKRLATRRVEAALKAIGYVHNLAKGAQYEHTPEQEKQIVEALQKAINQVRDAFGGVKPGKQHFVLF